MLSLPESFCSAPAVSHRSATRADVLGEIAIPGVNLCLWERGADPRWTPVVEALLAAPTPVRLDLKAPSVLDLTDALRHAAGGGVDCESLALDMAFLASLFGRIAGTRHPRLRLTRVEDDGCALFHADTLSLRLLCTYAGPGAQWLENNNVRRGELGLGGRSFDEATAAIVIDPERIRTIPSPQVAIFQGRLAPGEENNALVHRSAPVRGRDEFRLRLCLDLPDSCTC